MSDTQPHIDAPDLNDTEQPPVPNEDRVIEDDNADAMGGDERAFEQDTD